MAVHIFFKVFLTYTVAPRRKRRCSLTSLREIIEVKQEKVENVLVCNRSRGIVKRKRLKKKTKNESSFRRLGTAISKANERSAKKCSNTVDVLGVIHSKRRLQERTGDA